MNQMFRGLTYLLPPNRLMKDARIHIRLSKELKEKFEKKLKKNDITPSEFFRLAIKKYLR